MNKKYFPLNQIVCGDCMEEVRKLPDDSVDLVIFDPPYTRFYASDAKRKPSLGDFKVLEVFFKVLSAELDRVVKPTGAVFGFCDFRTYPILFNGFYHEFKPTNLIVWKKNFFGPGRHLRPLHELILYMTRPETKPPKDRSLTDIWEVPRVKITERVHSYQKPLELLRTIIKNCSESDAVVLDMFMGSGSTAVAAKQLGRDFIGFEINPRYVKICNERLVKEGQRDEK